RLPPAGRHRRDRHNDALRPAPLSLSRPSRDPAPRLHRKHAGTSPARDPLQPPPRKPKQRSRPRATEPGGQESWAATEISHGDSYPAPRQNCNSFSNTSDASRSPERSEKSPAKTGQSSFSSGRRPCEPFTSVASSGIRSISIRKPSFFFKSRYAA